MACSDILATVQQALSLQIVGNLSGAEALYRDILSTDPTQADAWYLLGQLCLQREDDETACVHLRAACEHAPDNFLFHLTFADVLDQQGKALEAEAAYRQALEIHPDSVRALRGLCCVLIELDRLDEAAALLDMAAALAPGDASVDAARGAVCLKQGAWLQAVDAFARAKDGGQASASLLNDLGVALKNLHRDDEAAEQFRAAVALDPDHGAALINFGNALKDEGEIAAAREVYGHALRIGHGDSLRVRMATLLPPVYASREEMLEYRAGFSAALDELLEAPLRPGDPVADGGHNNFYLCYQGENDRELQLKLAQVYRKIHQPRHREAPPPHGGKKTRVGFVSAFFREHTIGELNRGIIAHLDREQFEVFVFSVGQHEDAVARFIRGHADHYQMLPATLAQAEEAIAQCRLDVLLYTDIGMEPFTYFLAFSRLAPVQCVTWGHPVTTGIDTIDYFVSSVHQEPEGAQAHYSEKLVLLDAIPAYYYRPQPPERSRRREDFGLPRAARVYLCPQSLFKFHPDFDALLASLLEADGDALLVLPEGQHRGWTEQLRARFARSLGAHAGRVRFLPRLGYQDYLQLMRLCDVMLDPLHFGGGKTTLDALSLGVPIVTLPGEFMRGRAAFACYQAMELDAWIASSAADYVQRAVSLAADPALRERAEADLVERAAAIAGRPACVHDLEHFLQHVGHGDRTGL